MVQPTNYMLSGVDPSQALVDRLPTLQNMQMNRQAMAMNQQAMQGNEYKLGALQRQQQQEAERKQAFETRRAELLDNVKPEQYLGNALRLNSEFPELTKDSTDALKQMGEAKRQQSFQTAMQVRSLALAGQHQKAYDMLKKQSQAMRESGDVQNADAMDSIAQVAIDDPEHFGIVASQVAAMTMDPKDAADWMKNEATATNQGANAQKLNAETAQVAANAQAEREAKLAQAQAAVQNAKTAQMQAGNAAEANRLRAEELAAKRDANQLQREKWDYSKGLLPASLQPQMTEYVKTATEQSSLADRTEGLAITMSGFGKTGDGKPYRNVAEALKGTFGRQDNYTQARQQYLEIKTKAVGAMLQDFKPASNSDMDMVSKPFPSENDPPEYLAQYLVSMGRVARMAATVAESKAEWLAANKGMGKTKAPTNIMGADVPADVSYMEFRRKYLPQVIQGVLGSTAAPATPPPAVAGKSYMSVIGGK